MRARAHARIVNLHLIFQRYSQNRNVRGRRLQHVHHRLAINVEKFAAGQTKRNARPHHREVQVPHQRYGKREPGSRV